LATLRNKEKFQLLDKNLTYKVLPPLPPLQYDNCLFATILPPHQHYQLSTTNYWITNHYQLPIIGLYANSRCYSLQHSLNLSINIQQLLKKPASWKPKESSSGENLNSAGSLKSRQPTYINFLQSA